MFGNVVKQYRLPLPPFMSDCGFGELGMLPADDLQAAVCAEIGLVGAGGAAIGRAGRISAVQILLRRDILPTQWRSPAYRVDTPSLSRQQPHTNLARLVK